VDRARPGSKHHLITDAHGIPLTGGYRPDVTQLIPLVEAIPPIRGRHGRPARARQLFADRAMTTTRTGASSATWASRPRIACRSPARPAV
jgi:hypothetical protein